MIKDPKDFRFHGRLRLLAGREALGNIPAELEMLGSKKPLIITNRNTWDKGALRPLKDALSNSDLIIGGIFKDTPDYPSLSIVQKIRDLFSERGCDSIIALGASGVVNISKAVNLCLTISDSGMIRQSDVTNITTARPFIWVPMGATSGEEGTNRLRLEQEIFIKESFSPDLVVVDPEITHRSSLKEISESALVGLSIVLEPYLMGRLDPILECYAETSLGLIFRNLVHIDDKKLFDTISMEILTASYIASIILSNVQGGIIYTMAESMCKYFGIRHGISTGILLKEFLKDKEEDINNKFYTLGPTVLGFDSFTKAYRDKSNEKLFSTILESIKRAILILGTEVSNLNIPAYKLNSIVENAVNINPNFQALEYRFLIDKLLSSLAK